MARAFVYPYTGVRVETGEMILSVPINYVNNDVNLSGPTADVRVPVDATPQQIKTALLAVVAQQAAAFGVVINQNETLFFGFDKG